MLAMHNEPSLGLQLVEGARTHEVWIQRLHMLLLQQASAAKLRDISHHPLSLQGVPTYWNSIVSTTSTVSECRNQFIARESTALLSDDSPRSGRGRIGANQQQAIDFVERIDADQLRIISGEPGRIGFPPP
jgi:hypothetical protein